MKRRLPSLVFAAVYVLVLATQLPHIWAAYASLEDASIPLAQWTALGAAVAFELSIGVFTYRIVKGSRRRWTKRGLLFFIVASIVANAYYYQVWPFVFDFVMRVFATVALPLALALFAEEFGALEKLAERREKRAERKANNTEPEPKPPELEPSPQFATKREHIQHLLETEPGISQTELAAKAGASASYVSELVRVLTTKEANDGKDVSV